jgi:predicted nucleic-acid-binding protein
VRAIDTNVLVRFLTADDPQQFRRARKLMEGGGVFVPKTVLLETEWVLRRAYDLSRAEVGRAFEALAGAAEVDLEDGSEIRPALAWFHAGLDFADALHIASRGNAAEFLTFDKRLASAARRAGIRGVVHPDKRSSGVVGDRPRFSRSRGLRLPAE